MAPMTPEDMQAEIERLAPFHHDVELPHGLRTHLPELARRDGERTRVANLVQHAWGELLERFGGSLRGLRVLDVACSCGGFSVEAAKHAADYVLGIDVVDRYLEQAAFVKRALDLTTVHFRKLSAEELREDDVGVFDVSLCLGLLYHLENPVHSMKRIASVTKRMLVVDTVIARKPRSDQPVWVMNRVDAATGSSRDATSSLWRTAPCCQFTPNTTAVVELLRFLGFDQVVRLKPRDRRMEARYLRGDRATFLAVRKECMT